MSSSEGPRVAEGATPGSPTAGEGERSAGEAEPTAARVWLAASAPGEAEPTARPADEAVDGAASGPPETEPDEANETKFSFREVAGFVPVAVRYANVAAWVQRTVWVAPDCNSDHLKWGLRHHLGSSVSTWRVHEGFRGHPYDRYRPILEGPPPPAPQEGRLNGPILIVQSFGP